MKRKDNKNKGPLKGIFMVGIKDYLMKKRNTKDYFPEGDI
jgi:hypothetical protein